MAYSLHNLSEEQQTHTVQALNVALAQAHKSSLAYAPRVEDQSPTVAEAAFVTEIVREVLMHQSVPEGYGEFIAEILRSVALYCEQWLESSEPGTLRRLNGIDEGPDVLMDIRNAANFIQIADS